MSSYELGYTVGFSTSVRTDRKCFTRGKYKNEAIETYWKLIDRVVTLSFDDFIEGYLDGVQSCCKQEKLQVAEMSVK